jgi:hypothetical protein
MEDDVKPSPPVKKITKPAPKKVTRPPPPSSGFNHLGGGSTGSSYRPTGGGMRNLGRRRGG